jgi:hypothetical protein
MSGEGKVSTHNNDNRVKKLVLRSFSDNFYSRDQYNINNIPHLHFSLHPILNYLLHISFFPPDILSKKDTLPTKILQIFTYYK